MSAPQSFPTCHRRASRGHGFTLIELLVVITVIAILAALVLPAVFGVNRNAFELTVANDITQLDGSVEKFRNEFGFYPSDFSEFVDLTGNPLDFTDTLPDGDTVETRLKRFLAKISPMHNEDGIDPVDGSFTRLAVWWENVGKNLAVNFGGSSKAENLRGPQVALWYWLSQTYNDAQYPFSGKRQGTTTADDNGNGIPDNAEIISEKRMFSDIGTLEVIFTANYPDGQDYEIARTIQRGGDAPLLYFHNTTYVDPWGSGVADTTVINFAPGATSPNLGLPCRVPGSALADGLFLEPTKFQIVTAGYDESFGDVEDSLVQESQDNLCNFAEGGRLDVFVDNGQ